MGLLSVKNLTTFFQIEEKKIAVIEGLFFDLVAGETLALVGESGSGKTVTALSLLRILSKPPALYSTGEVLFGNKNLLTLSEVEMRSIRGKEIAMIFQDPKSALNPVYTIGEQLMEGAHAHFSLSEDEAKEKALEVLGEVALPAPERIFKSYPHQISGGMAQRAMIAMALICRPAILIADEPTTALDATIQAEILELLRTLQQKNGMAILLITHDMGVVRYLANEINVMYAGKIIEKGNVDAIFENPSHPYTRGLLAARPTLRGAALSTIPGHPPGLTERPEGCCFHPRCAWKMERCCQGDVPLISLTRKQEVRCWLHEC